MKEAFWGVLIVSLGLMGVVIVNVFQRVTTGNDQTYYLLKETSEAAMYDAIDYQHYRLNGDIRIVEDKYVENFTRRFVESLNIMNRLTDYNIKVEEITENPPRVSLSVNTSVTSLWGETFKISNRIDAILETKYDIKEITEFLDITAEEWENRQNQNKTTEADACTITTYGSEEQECITGDLEFTGFEDDGIPDNICNDGTYGTETRTAYYKVCKCGLWEEEQEEVSATPIKTGSEYIYNWTLHVDGEIRDIDETATKRVYIEKCTTGIQIYKPIDLRLKEPSADNSAYELCTGGNTTVNEGQTIVLHANYLPNDATNRRVSWTNSNNDALTMQYSNPITDEGYSRASITGLKAGEETIITATTTNGHTATCKVKVLDGNVDTVGCVNKTISVGSEGVMESTFTPYTATKTNFTWTSSNSSIGTIVSSSGVVKGVKAGTSTITVTSPNGKIGTCTLTVTGGGGGTPRSGDSCVCSDIPIKETILLVQTENYNPPICSVTKSTATWNICSKTVCKGGYVTKKVCVPGYIKYGCYKYFLGIKYKSTCSNYSGCATQREEEVYSSCAYTQCEGNWTCPSGAGSLLYIGRVEIPKEEIVGYREEDGKTREIKHDDMIDGKYYCVMVKYCYTKSTICYLSQRNC